MVQPFKVIAKYILFAHLGKSTAAPEAAFDEFIAVAPLRVRRECLKYRQSVPHFHNLILALTGCEWRQ